jgi:hypothetical protein
MQSLRGGWIRRTAVGAMLTTLALLAGLLASSTALAAPDPLAPSSSVVLQLKNFGGIKVKPKALNLVITRGELDPTTGAGTIETTGKFRAKRGGRKAKVKIIGLTLGANGGPGRLDAKIGKRTVRGFGKLSGGTLARDGWGAKLNGVTAKLGSKGAKALRRALSPGGGKKGGGKKASAAGGFKAGKRLGSVSVNAVPKTVEVLPGGTLEFEADPLFAIKLAQHCVNATLHLLDPSLPEAVTPIPPGTEPVLRFFFFPVTGGSIAPDFSSGRVTSAGGQKLTKNDDGSLTGQMGCSGSPPIGTSVFNTEFEAQFDVSAFASAIQIPAGSLGIGSLGPFDLASPNPGLLTPPPATTSVDPNTRQIVISDAQVTMDQLSAVVFNDVFPNGSGNPENDFKTGDSLGWMSLSVTTH